MKNKINVFFNISIVIPNYNRTVVLVESIRSVLNQTYPPIEIIVVDDKSSIDIKKYLNNQFPVECASEFIKIFVNKENVGAAASRNYGVNRSTGNYIAFLDSDDYWDKNKLMKQITMFQNNESLDLVYTDQKMVVDNIFIPSNKILIKNNLLDQLINGWTAPNTSTLLYKKETYKAIGGFDETLKSCQDHDLWFKGAINKINVDFVNEPLSYFVLDSNDRISFNVENRMDGVIMFLDKCRNYMNQSDFKKFKAKYLFDTSFPLFAHSLKNGRITESVKLYFKFLILNKWFYSKLIEKLTKQ